MSPHRAVADAVQGLLEELKAKADRRAGAESSIVALHTTSSGLADVYHEHREPKLPPPAPQYFHSSRSQYPCLLGDQRMGDRHD
jgi:hypothetical protein